MDTFTHVIESYYLFSSLNRGNKTIAIFIPGESYDIIEYMTANELAGKIEIYSFNVDLLPIDNDLLSLEIDSSFRDIYINKDLSCISTLVNAFVKLEACFGKVKYKYLKGDYAEIFDNLLCEKEKENDLKNTDEILGMVVFDRSTDFLTPLISNFTYEGLIDDFFGINCGIIKIKEKLLKQGTKALENESENDKIISYGLTSTVNNFYCILRCMLARDVYRYIIKTDTYYQNIAMKSGSSKRKESLNEINQITSDVNFYVSNIKQPLSYNENLMDYIRQFIIKPEYRKFTQYEQLLITAQLPAHLHDYYDEYLCDKKDLSKILRLMVIEYLTQGNINDYQNMKRDILNMYGYDKIFIFKDLEQLGWLPEKGNKSPFGLSYRDIYDKLQLFNLEYNDLKINDCSYICDQYCPLSLKLIENAIYGKWGRIQETLKKMNGFLKFPIDEKEIAKPTEQVNTIFLVFIGGVSYAEIEGVRFLNRKFMENFKKSKDKNPTRTQLIIITTGILSHKKIFDNLGKKIEFNYTMKQFYDQNKK